MDKEEELEFNELLKRKCWVVFTFEDETKETIYTTLSREILKAGGLSPKSGYLWDFRRHRFAAFRHDAIRVDVFREKPYWNEEVLDFADRYI